VPTIMQLTEYHKHTPMHIIVLKRGQNGHGRKQNKYITHHEAMVGRIEETQTTHRPVQHAIHPSIPLPGTPRHPT
jgi:hypothetical protein